MRKIELLKLLPENWSVRKIQTTLNLKSNHLIVDMKNLREGIVKVNMPRETGLSAENVQLVKDFYEREDNSRQLPGRKDVKSIKQPDGTRKLIQKKLILSNLKELYETFKKESTLKIGFTKFTLLRPQHCVLAGSAGTHTVCVCVYHQNVKLMLEGNDNSLYFIFPNSLVTTTIHKFSFFALGCNFKTLIENNTWFDGEYKSYSDLLRKFVCLQPTESCYFRVCGNCPKNTEIKECIEEVFEINAIEEISYKAWISTDRCKLINVTSDSSEFIDSLIESLEKLVQHDYIAKTQSKYYQELKNNLREGELLVTLDFSENYAVVIQDAVQGFYWNNTNIAILPSVVYYKENGSLKNLSFLGVLENTIHDTISVYMFQNRLIELIKLKIPNVNKIYYFTDGAPQHFKNKKNFKNLCLHNEDFGINAEWHFFATAHGKGPCDGLGGMVKSQARKACLQFGSQRNILNAADFYEWGQSKFQSINFIYCSNEDYIQTSKLLEERFYTLRAIKGTLEFHAFIPEEDSSLKIRTKKVSISSDSKIFKMK